MHEKQEKDPSLFFIQQKDKITEQRVLASTTVIHIQKMLMNFLKARLPKHWHSCSAA